MATLTIPHAFVAGTPALASEVNANFQAVVSWTQGGLSTDNFGILTSRSVALPSAPFNAILSINQTATEPALYISNSGNATPITIAQSGSLLGSGTAVLKISDPTAQVTANTAHLFMDLSGSATIPAIRIDHGTTTMSLTKTQLNLFNSVVQATSAGVLSATTVVASNDLTTFFLKIKGRVVDNESQILLKNNTDTVTYATVIGKSTGLELNLPDTADSYTFKSNGVTKAVIDNNGIDGQYLKSSSVGTSAIIDANVTPAKRTAGAFSDTTTGTVSNGPYGSPYSVRFDLQTITTTGPNKIIAITIGSRTVNNYFTQSGTSNPNLNIYDPSNVYLTTLYGFGAAWAGDFTGCYRTYYLNCVTQGTYTVALVATNSGGLGNTFSWRDLGITMAEIG